MCWLQPFWDANLPVLLGRCRVCPETLSITIPHGDLFDAAEKPMYVEDYCLRPLLMWPAMFRLRKICLEVEIPESRTQALGPIAAAIRQKFEVVERSDDSGRLSRVQLLDFPPEQTRHGDCKVITLVWEVSRIQAEGVTDAQAPGIDSVDRRCSRRVFLTPKEAATKRFIERWREEGSLLKFAGVTGSGD